MLKKHWNRPQAFPGEVSPGIDPPAQRCRWASGSSPPWRRPTLDHRDHEIFHRHGDGYQPSGWKNYVKIDGL